MSSASPLRVLVVSPHAQRGGAETYLLKLVTALPAHVRAEVVCLENGPLVDMLETASVPTDVIETGRRLGIATSAMRLRRHIARSRPDVVHANGVKAALTASIALVGRPEPLLWVKHDHSWDGTLARAIAHRCRLVVGVSSSVLAALRQAAPTRVVPPGVQVPPVETQDARRELRADVGAAPDDVVLIGVGRLDPAKGFDTAIETLAVLSSTLPTARLVIVGGDDPRQPGVAAGLSQQASVLGLGARVHLLGHRADAHRLIAGADVVLVTSRAVDDRGMGREGFGLVAAEALALGVPVVGFRDGATPEVVGSAGVLVDPGDVPGLAAGVQQVVAESALRGELVEAGRHQAERFTTEAWLRAMVAAYSDVSGASDAR